MVWGSFLRCASFACLPIAYILPGLFKAYYQQHEAAENKGKGEDGGG